MKVKFKPEPYWAFAWSSGQPYITSILGFSRRHVMSVAETDMNMPWKRIYRQGGRAIKVVITPKEKS